jgi:hypothetical protein
MFAGTELLRGKRRGYQASFINELLQIPSVTTSGFAYDYVGLGQFLFGIIINPSQDSWFGIGASAEFTPGTFVLFFGITSAVPSIAIDVISSIFASILFRSLNVYKHVHDTPDPSDEPLPS